MRPLKSTVATLAMGLFLSLAPAHADQQVKVEDAHFLKLLGHIEAPEGYDTVSSMARVKPPAPITEMSVAEVLNYQRAVIRNGSRSSAIGRYQFNLMTLAEMVEKHNIDLNRKFDIHLQDQLARRLMRDCGFYDPGRSPNAVGNCLARRWAALPVLTGARAGKSFYRTNGNKARTSTQKVHDALSRRFST